MTLIRNDKANLPPIGAGRYNIDLQSKVTLLQKTSKGGKTDDAAASHVHINVKTHEQKIKVP